MISSVSVMSSPSLDSRDPPQQLQATGPRHDHAFAGQMIRERFAELPLRVNDATVVVAFLVLAAAISAASSSSVAAVSRSSSVNSS